jgi:hypothetical protein
VILAVGRGSDVCERYGVWKEKSMYGKKYMGIERSTFLIDGEGKIARAWHKVKVPGHAEEVLEACARARPVTATLSRPRWRWRCCAPPTAARRPRCRAPMPPRGGRARRGARPRPWAAPPPRPAGAPRRPELLDPRDVPRRGPGSEAGRIAILHAVAHIELNAVDLHWDIIARFAHVPMPMGFFDDWVRRPTRKPSIST